MFTCRFSGRIDSKGRLTVPASIRNRLNIEDGDEISIRLESRKIIREEFGSNSEALNFVKGLDNVKNFSFDGEVLEVVLDE